LIPFRVDCAVEARGTAFHSLSLVKRAEAMTPGSIPVDSARFRRVRVFEETFPVLRPAGFPSPGKWQFYQR
jgi:hypothetical protein